MSEPTTPAIVAAGVAMGGVAGIAQSMPQIADISMICIAAIAGGAVQLSTMAHTDGAPYTKWQAAWYLLVTAGMALALTGVVAYAGERFFNLPHAITGMPIAFLIGARREWVLRKFTGTVDKATGTESSEVGK
jgi:hypothetical protein